MKHSRLLTSLLILAASSEAAAPVELARQYLQKMRETGDGQYLERATKIASAELASDPANYRAALLLAEAALFRHDFAAAAERARALAVERPGDPAPLGILGDALMEAGRYEEAGAAYERMIEKRPNQSSYNRIAYHRFVTGRPAEALAWMQTAVEAGSPVPENQAWCHVEFGDLLFKVGQTLEARRQYRAALELFPGHLRALAALARLEASEQKLAAATELFERAYQSVPMSDYASALAAIAKMRGDARNAARWQRLADAAEKLALAAGETANRTLALAYADSGGDLDRALALAEAEFAVRDDVYSYDAKAWVLFRRKEWDAAAAAMEKALRWNTPEPQFFFHAAAIAAARGDREHASELLAKLERLNPRFDFRLAAEAAALEKLLRR